MDFIRGKDKELLSLLALLGMRDTIISESEVYMFNKCEKLI